MGQTTPLKFDFDDTAPSALAEFTSVDVVPVLNGGTGVSSLAEFGGSLVGTSCYYFLCRNSISEYYKYCGL